MNFDCFHNPILSPITAGQQNYLKHLWGGGTRLRTDWTNIRDAN